MLRNVLPGNRISFHPICTMPLPLGRDALGCHFLQTQSNIGHAPSKMITLYVWSSATHRSCSSLSHQEKTVKPKNRVRGLEATHGSFGSFLELDPRGGSRAPGLTSSRVSLLTKLLADGSPPFGAISGPQSFAAPPGRANSPPPFCTLKKKA